MRWEKLEVSCVAWCAALVVMSGCSESRPNSAPVEVASEPSPLEIPIFDCQNEQLACLKDGSDAAACNDAFKQCLVDAGPKLMELATKVLECQEKATECVNSGGDSGLAQCRDEFFACVGIDIPVRGGHPDSDAGRPDEPPSGTQDAGTPAPPDPTQPPAAGGPTPGGHPAPGDPTPGGPTPGAPTPGQPSPGAPTPGGHPAPGNPFPGGPSHPGPGQGFPGLSDGGLPAPGDLPCGECIEDLLACLEAGTDPAECADQARECVANELPLPPGTQDAGQPAPPQGGPGAQPGGKRGGGR